MRLLAPAALAALALASPALPGIVGQAAFYPALGVFPGMALAPWLAGSGPSAPRVLLGLAISPLVAAGIGVLLVLGGAPLATAAWTVAGASWGLWVAAELLRPERTLARDPDPAAEPAPDRRLLVTAGIVASLYVAIPWLVNPFILIHWDGWVHGGIVWEILQHGIPPQDPRFAGLPLNYVWMFNFFIALLSGATRRDPFVFMALFNTLNVAVFVGLAYRLGLTLWRRREAAAGAMALMFLGLNAGAWLLGPPWETVRALVGHDRGWSELRRSLAGTHLGTHEVLLDLSAPFARMVNVIDKFTLGTGLSYAWILFLLYLWAMLRWSREGARETLAWAGLAAAGMLFIHGVVGLSVIPVALATLGVAWLLRGRMTWLPSRARLVAFAIATLIGATAALPYTLAISKGWAGTTSGIHHSYLRPSLFMLWTFASSCLVAFLLAAAPLRRALREHRGEAALLSLFMAAMLGFGLLVHLPLDNETKFVFQVFFPLAGFAGTALLPWLRAVAARRGAWAAGLVAALLFLVQPAAILWSYSVDPARHTRPELNPAPGEDQLDAWIGGHTEPAAVLVDEGGRDLLMVRGPRRLWAGTTARPELAGFPARGLMERRAVAADLYGSGATLDQDARALAALGQPVYVLYRERDLRGAAPWRALDARPDRFTRVYAAGGYRVYRVRD